MNGDRNSLKVDPVATDQFFGDLKNFAPLKPERELMVAVLADAIECYWKYSSSRDGTGIKLYQEATDWIFAEDEEQPFSFLNICEALKFDPGYIRRGLRDWQWRRLGIEQATKRLTEKSAAKKLKRSSKNETRGIMSFSRSRGRISRIRSNTDRPAPKR
jgi:hypothetical protein